MRMRRRTLVSAFLAGLVLCAAPVLAQQPVPPRVPRVGILTPAESDQTPIFEAFRRGLKDLGYTEGRSIAIEFRSARGNSALLPRLAAELVALPVDIIVTDGAAAARVAQEATRRIPIVMGTSGIDPVALGLVPSLRRPGGNLTGFTLMHGQLGEKRVDLVRTLAPEAKALTVLVNPVPGSDLSVSLIQSSARTVGMAVRSIEAATPEALRALRPGDLLASGNPPLLVVGDAMFWNNRQTIVDLVNAARVPALYPEREYAESGGLMAYGAYVPDNFRAAAGYVHRILKGENPADLPIQEPVKVELIINLKTAKALGMEIPVSLLGRADQVIE
jgi:putative tryptophan/tyrosine transport system substrate-binding protein